MNRDIVSTIVPPKYVGIFTKNETFCTLLEVLIQQ